MKIRAIGLVELNSVAKGILAADEMLKSASVEIIMARPVCPGRYLVLVTGDTGSVTAAVEAGKAVAEDLLVDWFVIPHVHPTVLQAIHCASMPRKIDALGIIETYSSASCISASDVAAKAGNVDLIEVRLATGMAGKSFVTMTGDVNSVQSSVDAAVGSIKESGLVLSQVVIPSLSPELVPNLM